MTAFLSDQDVARRVLDHIANKTTDAGEEVWREPVQNYLCPRRFEEELQAVLRRYPTPFCPSAALPEAGSYVARTAAGIPLVLVRGDDGVVRGFRNACRHRGAQVAQGSGCTRAFRCNYHGWTYQLNGALQHVPHEAGFPGLDKAQHGLSAVRVWEQAGLIFVSQQEDEAGANLDELPEFFSDQQQLFDSSEYTLDLNWKVFLESFLEGYHIKPAHKETFYPFGFDNLNLVETVGRNSRITFPFQRIKKLEDIAPEQREVDGLLTYVYHLFPNVTIAVLSHHTTMLVLEPLAVDRTQVISYSLTNKGTAGDEALGRARNDAAFVKTTGQSEDIALANSIQASLHSGANDHFTFGRYEKLIGHFHRNMQSLLDRR
ncbi:MAG: Rieske 2Fe-2S domain-containing protein [Halioglobus sp.]|nr:Rieske 2Fe-2S domain-containing protein [Halioglobus sp.]